MAQSDLSAWGLYKRAPKLFKATITHANITAAGASQAFNLGTIAGLENIPAGSIILGAYFKLNTTFVLAGDATFVASALTIGGVDFIPVDNFDLRSDTATAGVIVSEMFMRPGSGAVSLTLTGDVDINPTSAGSLEVGIIYFLPEA
jgi:hypothetical protein